MSGYELYRYSPSLALAVVAIVFFFLTSMMHTYQLIRTRTLFFIPLVIGTYFEWIGYIGRAANSQQTPDWATGPYILQSLLLLIAPALFAASIYMTLGRIVRLCNAEEHLWIRARWLTKLFVIGDSLSFFIQATGGGIQAGKQADSLTNGAHIVLVGLFVQVVFFCLFVTVGARFYLRMTNDVLKVQAACGIPWRKHMMTLFAASGLILVRSVYRIIEYIQGNDGFVVSHEWFLYVFDALLMLAVLVLFNFVHGSELNKLLKHKYKTIQRQSEEMTAISA